MSNIWSRLINLAGNITGTLPIANGGTGQTTARLAINALAGSQTDNRVLQGNGTNIVLGQIDDPTFFAAGAYNDGTSAGTLPIVTAMSNSLATQMGLKQYLSSGSYSGGLAPTTTNNKTNPVPVRAVYVPYLTQDGSWRIRFNIAMTQNSATQTQIIISVTGIVFKNLSGYFQPVAGLFVQSGSGLVQTCWADPNTNNIIVTYSSATGCTGVCASGDVELDLKPTWAY